jgi:hypothetical protein
MPEQLSAFATTLLAISLATERLVVLAKTLFPALSSGSEAPGPEAVGGSEGRRLSERARRLTVMGVGFVAAWLTAGVLADGGQWGGYFANLFLGTVAIADHAWPVPVVALLASGGSAFWAQVVGYASAVKDVRQKVAAATPGSNG